MSGSVGNHTMAAMARRVASPVFVGRHAELERVAEGLRVAGEGQPAAFLVGGEAGAGKTRFVAEVAQRARQAGFRVISGGCVAFAEGALPYAPIVEALRGLPGELSPAALDALLGAGRSDLVRLMPVLQEAEVDRGGADASAQGRLFEFLLAFLGRLAAERPLLCVVEDLHWADRSTLDLVTFAVRAIREVPIVLLATYRSDELHRRHLLLPVLAELERSGRIERIDLARLDRVELETQLAGILGEAPAQDLAERIWRRSGGNPFYAEELLAAGAGDPRGTLPDSLREVLLARVGVLSEPTQELLRIASAGGVRIAGPLLAGVSGTSEEDLVSHLREAVERQVIVTRAEEREGYAFRHALLQEALYGELLPTELTRLHAAYAGALSMSADWADPAVAAELAHHWSASHDLPRALEASIAAGIAAERTYAFAEAQAQYERALECWERVPDAASRAGRDRAALHELAAGAASHAGAIARATSHIRSALALVDPEVDPVRAGLLHDLLGRYAREAGEGEASFAAHREAVRLVPADPPSPARARVLAGLARRLMYAAQYAECADVAREANGVARRTGAQEVEANALATLGPALGHLGNVEEAVASLRDARDLALAINDHEGTSRAWNNLAAVLDNAARLVEAARERIAAADWADAHGLARSMGAFARCSASLDLWELGRWDEAQRAVEQVRQVRPEAEIELLRECASALLNSGRGRIDAAVRSLAHARQLWRPGTHAELEPLLPFAEVQLYVWRTDREVARRAVDASFELLHGGDLSNASVFCGYLSAALRIEADIATTARRHRDQAGVTEAQERGRAILAEAHSLAASIETERAALSLRPRATLALCEAEWSRCEGVSDAGVWAEAAAACVAASLHYLRPYALFRQAEATLAEGGDRSVAEPILHVAHAAATEMGAAPLQAEIEGLARQARLPLEARAATPGQAAPQRAPADVFGLTRREREVLALLAAGRTNRQIGEALFISEKTASVHVSNIMGKLGVAGRTEAAARAYKEGLVKQVPD